MGLSLDFGTCKTHVGEGMIFQAAEVPKLRRALPPLAGHCRKQP